MTGAVTALLALAAVTAPLGTVSSAAARLEAAAPLGAAAPAAPTIITLQLAVPDVGAVLTKSPAAVRLTFDQALSSGEVTVTGPAGAADAGDATVGGTTLTDPLRDHLPDGTYTVTWRAKPKRGRPATGSYAFSIATALTSPSSSPVSSTTPTVPAPSAQPVAGQPSGSSSTTPAAAGAMVTGTATPTTSGGGATAGPNGGGASTATTAGSPQLQPGAGPSVAAGATSADEDEQATPTAVKAIAAHSSALGAWLIAFAVLVQAVIGLYGLRRWRQASRAGPPDRATSGPGEDNDALDETEALADDLALQRMLAERRPWTGELPAQGASQT